jgi:N-acetylmuramic acid 6-phosphate (MurNAc-6-P) etherase
VADVASVDPSRARALLEECGWELPLALLRGKFGGSPAQARERLARHGGSVDAALRSGP